MAKRPKSPQALLDGFRTKMLRALDGKLREEFVSWGSTPQQCARTLIRGLEHRINEGTYRLVDEWSRAGDQPKRWRVYDFNTPGTIDPRMRFEDFLSLRADNPYLVLSFSDDAITFAGQAVDDEPLPIDPDTRYTSTLLLQPGASLKHMDWETFMQEYHELTPWDIVKDNRLVRRYLLPTAGSDDLQRIIRFSTNAHKALDKVWQYDTVVTHVIGKFGKETVTDADKERLRDASIDVEDEIYNLQSKLRTAQEATYHLIESAYAKQGKHTDDKDAMRVRKLLEATGANPPLLAYLKQIRGIAQVNAAFGMREQLQHGKPAFSYGINAQRMHLTDHRTGDKSPAYETLATHYEKVTDAIAETVRLLYATDMRTQLRAIYR